MEMNDDREDRIVLTRGQALVLAKFLEGSESRAMATALCGAVVECHGEARRAIPMGDLHSLGR